MTEAEQREAVIAEALSWIGTPFRDCADVKGRNGGVDCVMSLVRWFVDSGMIEPFDPRPYSPQIFLHQEGEPYLEWIDERLHLTEIPEGQERRGDLAVYKVGYSFAHGTLILSDAEIIHAYKKEGCVLTSRRNNPNISQYPRGGIRPVRYFDPWRRAC